MHGNDYYKSQERDYFLRTEDNDQEGGIPGDFEDGGNVLFLDLGVVDMRVPFRNIC